ncbi:MAG: 30S ribosomal protein S17 [Deltaproteobacteria bacterium RBG_13_61_14]|jgi:small subunit ribosomal protein S17|nr:MAG: 30S ribosomal protein S17 [Deltaproteobacteria bacterium RBG_13_61_14]
MRERGQKKVRQGVVVSDRMQNTVVVVVTRQVLHPRYHKYIRRRSRFMAHDASNACKVGDRVEIIECRPLSKNKRWRVIRVVEKAA